MKTQFKKTRESQSGQSTVEFALTLSLLMAFVLFFIQLSLVFGFGNYIHYATFMAARAYLSAGMSKDDQKQRAINVIVQTLKKSQGQQNTDRFPGIARAEGGGDLNGLQVGDSEDFSDGGPDSSWMQGVRYKFKSRVVMLPLAGRTPPGGGRDQNFVSLTSESWLGREPSWQECRDEMATKGIIDNGC